MHLYLCMNHFAVHQKLTLHFKSATHQEKENGNPLQRPCLENPTDRGAWRAAVHGVAESQTLLSDLTQLIHQLKPNRDFPGGAGG